MGSEENSEVRFRALIEKNADMIAMISEEGKFIYASRSFTEVLGYTNKELLALKFIQLIHPDDLLRYQKQLEDLIKNPGKTISQIQRYLHKNGNYLYCEGTITNMLNEAGVNALVSNSRDITEKREAEILLNNNFLELEKIIKEQSAILNTLPANTALLHKDGKRTEEEMNLLINNAEESFILLDKDLKIVSFNNQFQNLYEKYLLVEIKRGQSIIDYALPERKEAEIEIYKSVLNGNIEISELTIPIPNNGVQTFYLKFNPAKDKEGNIFGVFVTVADITEKKQSEIVKEFEKRNKEALINSTDDMIWSVTKDYNLIAANKSFLDGMKIITGKYLKLGDNLLMEGVFPSEYLILWKDFYTKSLNGQSFKTEIFTDASICGIEMWTETSFNPIINGNKVEAIACYSRNITERKNTEETIKRNEALLAEAQNLAKLGSWDFDFQSDEMNWSEEMYNVFGIKKDSIILSHDVFVNLIDEEYKELVIKNCESTQLTGDPFSIEYTITINTGEQKTIQERGYGKKNKDGTVDRMFGTVQDITERKQAEEKLIHTSNELQKALNDLNKIMDSSLDVICAVNEQGYFVKVSAACKTVWGYSQDELIGKQIFDFIYHEDHEKSRAIANKVMTGKNISHFENRYVRKDGSIVPISWAASWDPIDKIRYGVARDITEKKRLENAFETERQQFFDLFSKAPSSMGFLSGPEHVFEMANPLYLHMIGKSNIIGKKAIEVVPEMEEQGVIAILDGVYNTGESFTANEMHLRFDKLNNGKLVDHYINLMYQAHKGNDGNVNGILFFSVDVTQQVVMRKKIEENEARLNEAQGLANMGSWEIDLIHNITLWSDNLFTILGVKKNQIKPSPENFISFVHPDDVEGVRKSIQKTHEKLKNTSHDFRFIRKDGEVRFGHVERKFDFDKNKKPIRLCGVIQDVTEQKKVQLLISKSEKRLAEAQALAKVGNWETDLETLNVSWSAETFRIFELPKSNFNASHPEFLNYVHPEDIEKVNTAFYESFSSKIVNSIEHRIVTPNGNEKLIEERWQIVKDKTGKPIRAIGTCQDITERKTAEEERTKITNDLIQRNRDLEQFAFIISHNLRAPTANIIGFSENLLNESLTPQEEKEFLKGLSISVNRLDSVIKDLNKILQVRREIEGQKELISFEGLVNDISISIENIIDKNHVQIKTDFSEAKDIYSLKGYLYSIFFNLISNSIKYHKPNTDSIIEIKSKNLNGKTILTFKDNGLGIDLKTKGDKIFGLYKRFHLHVEGKGLGLFMVKTQIEAIGGTISIQSEPNQGTKFTLEFESQNYPK